jgi:NADPH-dependent glutamate synthase beta subunit-like oxidoreductase/dihydroorotate dehydrogenase/Pyruvate/2-oxoacid:ferredoxin oxidoreductase delta subunit
MKQMKHGPEFLTEAQLRAEIEKCEYCREKPCREACPADVSPADFIMAVRVGAPSDYRRAAALIMGANPLGGVCGALCPERYCVQACVKETIDRPVRIPAVQAEIIRRAKRLKVLPHFPAAPESGRRAAVIGAGPAGLAAAALLAQNGLAVAIFEREDRAGGMVNLIPDFRFNKEVLRSDIRFLSGLGRIRINFRRPIDDPHSLLEQGFAAVVVAAGLDVPLRLGIPGEEQAQDWISFLSMPTRKSLAGRCVAVIGGGAVAADCAETASRLGATVEMICLETLGEMPLTAEERAGLFKAGVLITGRSAVTAIRSAAGKKIARIQPMRLPKGQTFKPSRMIVDPRQPAFSRSYDGIIVAIGGRSRLAVQESPGLFYAGDMAEGPGTVVSAVASGKNAAQRALDWLAHKRTPKQTAGKSRIIMPGLNLRPVPLQADFFGRAILSPFLLSASPATDGAEQLRLAYRAGWAGGVLKTAFDGGPIHIPAEYMFDFGRGTYGNCDNVSGHALDRVCREIEELGREFPERLTVASTGGPVTGAAESDRAVWQANTRKLEAAGAMAIEYSLSCPQGGDGSRGDIVSQDAELTAEIVDWVLSGASRPDVPKLFKLTGAVTAIAPILQAVRAVFARHPRHRAGVTLANSFPGLAFRPGEKAGWDEGIVIGLSGEGILPISYLTLAKAAGLGCRISGNGGPMNYRQAADFLALGAESVQFCSLALHFGVEIVEELHAGLSGLLDALGLRSVSDLIGRALPRPIRDFPDLSAKKRISTVERRLCVHCGNCCRCPYQAIELDRRKIPHTDPARCIGCSLCAQRCFAGALSMRERSEAERAVLRED